MSIPVLKFNEAAFQLLFSLDMGTEDERALVSMLMRELKVSRKHVGDALELARAIYGQKALYDEKIGATAQEYALERIGRVERNAMRFALHAHFTTTEPRAKVIAEALRLTKKFSTKEGCAFVNAILDEMTNDSALSPQNEPAAV